MPTGTTRIRLRPANNSRVPFWGQLAIGLFWLTYVLFGILSNTGAQDYHFLHWVLHRQDSSTTEEIYWR